MMLVIALLTAIAVYLVHRHAAAEAEHNLRQEFRSELASLDRAEKLRYEALAARCRTLVRNPRLHAALEDNALDLLYPSAKDELRDLMRPVESATEQTSLVLRATFYRFLDANGSLIPPPNPAEVGPFSASEQSQITINKLPELAQIGYFSRDGHASDELVEEVIALPIFSTETGEVISALLVGFKPFQLQFQSATAGMRSGIWVNRRLYLPSLSASANSAVSSQLTTRVAPSGASKNSFAISLDGKPHLLFFRILNPGSVFPPAYQVCIYPIEDAINRWRKLQARIIATAVALFGAGFLASHFASARLSRPVEKLAIESRENLAERRRAEASLAHTSRELQRSARFSADASHQLKSPVSVLRVGIESLLRRGDLDPAVCDELSSLLHQTYRLTGVIDDLLLLSQMDAGRLQLEVSSVDLSQLIDEWLDDLNALPEAMDIEIEKEVPAGLHIAGERHYTSLIVQNLLENARKYNWPDGRIRIVARQENDFVLLRVGNTGKTIPPEKQEHIFERFHRGGAGENITGHGLGLNLARDLARLHGGELRLVLSANDWTEFEVCFPNAAERHNGARPA